MPDFKPIPMYQEILRTDIPAKFGLKFNRATWNTGFVVEPGHVFLFVTLDKDGMADSHQYADWFLSGQQFQWQSQNRTKQNSKHGRLIRNHANTGYQIHLFVRKSKKVAHKTAPFTYCGDLEFVSWQGEQPITVIWKLLEPIDDSKLEMLKTGSTGSPEPAADVANSADLQSQLVNESPANDSPPEPVSISDFAQGLVGSDRYRHQCEKYARLRVPPDAVAKVLSIAEANGGTVSFKVLANSLGLSHHRLIGLLTTIQRLLNIDGLELIQIDRALEQITIIQLLLKQEYA